ncbi:MAG: APC family permease, partial [Gemmatimonadaceae bacterium]
MTPPAHPANPDALLARELGVRQLGAGIFNYIVASGIFALPAFAAVQLGAAAPLAYLACAVLMGLVVVCLAEAGSRVSATGGPSAYVDVALGPLAGLVAGALLLLTDLSATAAVSSLFSGSFLRLFGAADTPTLRAIVTMALLVALAATNVRGVRAGSRVIEMATVAKLLPLLLFVFVGAASVNTANLAWTETPSVGRVLGTSGLLIFAFAGIEAALIPSGEVRDPARTVPRAAFLALGVVTLLYLAVQAVALGILGPALATDRVAPLASAAERVAGAPGRTLLVAGAT